MPKTLSIGSSLVDIFITAPDFDFSGQVAVVAPDMAGGKLPIDSFKLRTGGGASNTAVGFSRQGFEASVISEMGYDQLSELVVQEFQQEGVQIRNLVREKREETGGSVILVDSDGERLVFVHRGAAAMLDPEDIDAAAFWRVGWVHVSSLGGRIETLQKIGQLTQVKEIPVSWNPGSAELAALAAGSFAFEAIAPTVVLVNKQEWQTIEKLQNKCLQQVKYTIVTDGERGGIVYMQGKEHRFGVAKKDKPAVDATGAGDAFAVGFVSGLLRDESLETCIQLATKNAASVVQYVGAKRGLLHGKTLG